MTEKEAIKRLKEIKKSIESESISYAEIAELQTLRKYIAGDTVLAEWAGIEETINVGDEDHNVEVVCTMDLACKCDDCLSCRGM